MTGISSSLARIFSPRLISEISTWRFSALALTAHQLEVVDDDEPEPLAAFIRLRTWPGCP